MNRKNILTICAVAILVSMTLLAFAYYGCHMDKDIDVLEQLCQGDFTSLKELDAGELQELTRIYERHQDTDRMQWVYADINHDGNRELIWQGKDYVADSQIHRILAVFAVTPEGCRRVLWDPNDMGEFYFCHEDKMIYTSSYQAVYAYYFYGVCEFDADWKHTIMKFYEIYNIDDVTEYDSTVLWSQFDWAKEMDYEEGVYYVTGTQTADQSYERVLLEKEEWLEQFGEDIGIVMNLFLQLCNPKVTYL